MVKLVRDEPESAALRAYIGEGALIACDLVLAEVPRAVQRAVALDRSLPADLLLQRAGEVLDALALVALDESLLRTAGALTEPALRTLDAIHVVAAVSVMPIDAFITYDERQGAAARLAGLRTVAPAGG